MKRTMFVVVAVDLDWFEDAYPDEYEDGEFDEAYAEFSLAVGEITSLTGVGVTCLNWTVDLDGLHDSYFHERALEMAQELFGDD